MLYIIYIDNILNFLIVCYNIIYERERIAMANISNAVNMSFRVDKDLKMQADELFKSLGMNTSVALNMFLTQSVREQCLPFDITMKSPEPSKDLKEALKELKDVENGKIKLKSYHNVHQMLEDILNED